MSELENKNQKYENYEQAEEYIQAVRDLYVSEEYYYQGRRDQDQKDIAWFAADTAREIANTSYLGVMGMKLMGIGGTDATRALENPKREVMAGVTWEKYVSEFENLLENFAVITHKIDRDGLYPNVPSYINLSPADQLQVGMALFADFQDHNARRFGVKTAGIKQTGYKTVYPDDGGAPTTVKYEFDPDQAKSNGAIENNMRTRGFRSGVAVHQAGKISTEEYDDLRGSYPTEEKDKFDYNVSFYQGVRRHYEEEVNK